MKGESKEEVLHSIKDLITMFELLKLKVEPLRFDTQEIAASPSTNGKVGISIVCSIKACELHIPSNLANFFFPCNQIFDFCSNIPATD